MSIYIFFLHNSVSPVFFGCFLSCFVWMHLFEIVNCGGRKYTLTHSRSNGKGVKLYSTWALLLLLFIERAFVCISMFLLLSYLIYEKRRQNIRTHIYARGKEAVQITENIIVGTFESNWFVRPVLVKSDKFIQEIKRQRKDSDNNLGYWWCMCAHLWITINITHLLFM